MAWVTITDEDKMTRPTISKKAMLKIVATKDKYIKDRDIKIATLQREEEAWIHIAEEEKKLINKQVQQLKNKERMIYLVGLMTYLVGTLTGYLIHG